MITYAFQSVPALHFEFRRHDQTQFSLHKPCFLLAMIYRFLLSDKPLYFGYLYQVHKTEGFLLPQLFKDTKDLTRLGFIYLLTSRKYANNTVVEVTLLVPLQLQTRESAEPPSLNLFTTPLWQWGFQRLHVVCIQHKQFWCAVYGFCRETIGTKQYSRDNVAFTYKT